jgi:tetratricopeptide (TPR) repeat protein
MSGTARRARRFYFALTTICLVALALRAIILFDYLAHNPLAQAPYNDARTYWEWAQRIADGQLLLDTPYLSAPLYPHLLGAARAIGATLPTVYTTQMLLHVATAVLLAITARRRFGDAAGLLSATLFLMLMEPASAALRVLASTLQLLLIVLTWTALTATEERASTIRLTLLGLAIGLLCLACGPAMVLLILVPLWLIWQRPRPGDAARATIPLVVAGLCLLPATLHNYHATGAFFLVRGGAGVTLWHGNLPGSIGTYTPVPGISASRDRVHQDAARAFQEATGREPTWKAVDRYFRDQVVETWTCDPAFALRLAGMKAHRFLTGRQYADIYQPRVEIASGLNRALLLAPLPTPWLLAPGLVGLALMLNRPRHHAPEWLLIVAPLLVTLLFYYSPRYRLPAVPIVTVAAAYTLCRSWPVREHWRIATATGVALLAGVATGSLNRAIGNDLPDPVSLPSQLALALERQGDLEDAIEKHSEVLAAHPNRIDNRRQRSNLLARTDRPIEAIDELREILRRVPNDTDALRKLARLLFEQKRYADARPHLARLVAQHPDDALLLAALAVSEQSAGEGGQAAAHYARALQLQPDDHATRLVYASLLVELQRLAEAREQFTLVVDALPDNYEALHKLGLVSTVLGDTRAGEAHLLRALEINPRAVPTLYALGELYRTSGRNAEAAARFRDALEIGPDNRACQAALRRLEIRPPPRP